jgi:hypothetical protein
MGTYFKELDDRDEATLLYNQVKMLLGFICVVISSEHLYALISGAGGGVIYVADLLALLAVGCILIRKGLKQTLALVEFYRL